MPADAPVMTTTSVFFADADPPSFLSDDAWRLGYIGAGHGHATREETWGFPLVGGHALFNHVQESDMCLANRKRGERKIMNDLEKLFVSELKDIYDGEQQLVEALGELEKNAVSGELKSAFREHLQQTKGHVNRLEQVFQQIGEEPKRKTCHGIEGIVDEGQMIATEFNGNSALDAALIAAAQKTEHYEITSYGSLCSWAEELGQNRIVELLKQNLSEEKETDAKLSRLAVAARNPEARRQNTEKKSETSAAFSKMATHGT